MYDHIASFEMDCDKAKGTEEVISIVQRYRIIKIDGKYRRGKDVKCERMGIGQGQCQKCDPSMAKKRNTITANHFTENYT